jgi:two-component system phosphate regulon response regulator OmpR
MFAERPGQTVRREEFVKDTSGGERAVDVQINRLRRKIEPDPSNPIYLQTARGIGYRLLVD